MVDEPMDPWREKKATLAGRPFKLVYLRDVTNQRFWGVELLHVAL